ncbi:MAG: histidinolphosphatase [Watsoniomyces obsoletus]|nr:MAG: histidinolphosphatase [Watsoniomyces obsoletus]
MASQRTVNAPSVTAVTKKEESKTDELKRTRKVLVDTTGNIQVSNLALRSGKDAKPARPLAVRERRPRPQKVRKAARPQPVELIGDEQRPLTLQDGLLRWRAYRTRQREGRGHGKHGMWTDEYECAFVEALWIWWPYTPRKMIPLGDDKYGINELVGHYVSMRTKDKRARKQTSSHKQVIKGYFGGMHGWEELVIDDMMGPRNQQDDAPLKKQKEKELEAYLLPMSREERHPPPRKKNEDGVVENDASDEEDIEHPEVWPVRFTVRVEKTSTRLGDPTASNNVHTHTTMVVAPRTFKQMPLNELESWETYFPCFRSLLRNEQLSDCELISMNAKLNMPVEMLSRASTLDVDLEVFADPRYANHLWQCLTKVYGDGDLVWSVTAPVSHEDTTDGNIKLQLPFAAEFWSEMLDQLGVESAHKSKREAIADISRHMSKMSVVQELRAWAPPAVGGATMRPIETKRVAMFLWRFAATKRETQGKTTWRSVSLKTTPGEAMEMTKEEVDSPFPHLPPPASSLAPGSAHAPPLVRWALPGMQHSATELVDNTAMDVHTPLDEAYESQHMPELSGGEGHLATADDDTAFHPGYYISFDDSGAAMPREGVLESTNEPATIATHLLTQPSSIHQLHGFGGHNNPCVPSSTDETYESQSYASHAHHGSHAHPHPFDIHSIRMDHPHSFPSSMPMQMYEHSTTSGMGMGMGMVGGHHHHRDEHDFGTAEEMVREIRRRTRLLPPVLFSSSSENHHNHQVRSGSSLLLPAPTRVR